MFNDNTIKEADKYTEENLDNTYLNMEVTLSRDSDRSEYAKVTKWLRDTNSLSISIANNNTILDTRLYKVEYLNGYQTSLTANTIAKNLFS